ncbi:LCP family protein [Ruania albidiflava]|uniref:LCP family protein n=1 Tax=Ruania albidiflava TaxID=366586 RepID=UPI0003B5ED53|nr:LCP family protein [Ruania albidiflava]
MATSDTRTHRGPRHSAGRGDHPLVRGLLVALVGVLAFTGTGAAFAYQTLQSGIERHDVDDILGSDRPTREPANPDDPNAGNEYNILVMGSDSRDGDNQAIGGGDVEGMRSDTTLLVHVAADRSRVDVVSIPRDLVVDIPSCPMPDGSETQARLEGYGWSDENRMWNVPFALGANSGDLGYAAACTIKTFENMTDVPVDDFVIVDMAGMERMVDAIGGVEMCFEEDMVSDKANLNISAGCHTLDGETAVAFARARKGPGMDGSDIGRIGRQQELLTNMVDQVLSRNLLTDSGELYRFLRAATSSLTTGEEIGDLTAMAGLAYSLRDIDMADVNFATVPFDWAGNRVRPNYLSAELWDSIRADEPMALPEDEQDDADADEPADDGGTADTGVGDGQG